MTTIDPASIDESVASDAEPVTRLQRVEAVLERASEWLNPILVKEARQALKSRQFMITFGLLLICGWGWSLLGVAINGQSRYAGALMLTGYYLILAFPMAVIVPFSAFRSLAGETEDGTYELLSITTLRPSQIVGGKLGSAILQMIVYYSALSPCIAFTYLLRGIDILSILLLLSSTFYYSIVLSVFGLFLATVAKARHWQVVLSVAIVIGLAFSYLLAAGIVVDALDHGNTLIPNDDDFWVFYPIISLAFGSYALLAFFGAASAISFNSDNRSTRLRIVLGVQQFLLFSVVTYLWVYDKFHWEVLAGGILFATIHWGIVGAMMIGEEPHISQRVARSLPDTVMGRLYLSLFTPGPATGYLFATANLLSFTVLATIMSLVSHMLDLGRIGGDERIAAFAAAMWCYLAIFLGLGKLGIDLLRRWIRTGPGHGLLVVATLVIGSSFFAFVTQMSFTNYYDEYSLLQIANPFWTTIEFIDGWSGLFAGYVVTITILLSVASIIVIYCNLLATAKQTRRQRQAVPQRVLEDEAELHPEVEEKPQVVQSPWDDVPDPDEKPSE